MPILKDRLIFVSTLSAAILNIILWLILAGKFGFSGARVPLHYSVVYGIDFLGSARKIYEIPLTGAAAGLINFWLAGLLYEREKLFAYLLSFSSAVLQLILLAGALALVVLNA
jgi:hypothetical protein